MEQNSYRCTHALFAGRKTAREKGTRGGGMFQDGSGSAAWRRAVVMTVCAECFEMPGLLWIPGVFHVLIVV